MPKPKLYGGKTVKQHATELDEKIETVRGWLEKHGMPADEPARSEWVAQWRRTRLNRPKYQVDETEQDIVYQKHEADLQGRRLKNASLALDLEKKRGRLIDVEEAKRLQTRLAAMVKQVFLELPNAVADLIDPDDPEWVVDILEKDVRERLQRLSNDSNGNGQTEAEAGKGR